MWINKIQIIRSVVVRSLSCVWLFATPQTVAQQAAGTTRFSVHWTSQARGLGWAAIFSSRASSWLNPRLLHCRRILGCRVTREVQLSDYINTYQKWNENVKVEIKVLESLIKYELNRFRLLLQRPSTPQQNLQRHILKWIMVINMDWLI